MQLTLCASRLSADSPDWAGKHEDANSPMGKVGLLELLLFSPQNNYCTLSDIVILLL
jgi:hypothetical protein